MKLIERTGDLFKYTGEAIGHGVNTMGVMGAGIAKQFAERWPEMYEAYRERCMSHQLQPGDFFAWEAPDKTLILNLATQQKPGNGAQTFWVRASLMKAAVVLQSHFDIHELALPRIGCGIGGLKWEFVSQLIQGLEPQDFTVVVYSLEEW